MNVLKQLFVTAGLLVSAFAAADVCAAAQDQPAPAPTATPTFIDKLYDGNWHVQIAPYIWGPQVRGTYQYSIPTTAGHGGRRISQGSFQVTPASYVANLNSAAMVSFDARKGIVDVFGDYIYTNASASASANETFIGPGGRVQVPISLSTDAHLRSSIWEAAAGMTIARSPDADLSMFMGLREFPLDITLDYNATIGKRKVIAPSGTITSDNIAQDVIFGVRGRAFLGDGRWYIPYYFDVGTGAGQLGNQTWQAYAGAGYAFNHGQTLLATWRSLNYYGFAPISPVQKLTFAGPLIGYTFQL